MNDLYIVVTPSKEFVAAGRPFRSDTKATVWKLIVQSFQHRKCSCMWDRRN